MAISNIIDKAEAQRTLATWWSTVWSAATTVEVSGVEVPHTSGMSSESILFHVEWIEGGRRRAQDAVARVIPSDSHIFPAQDFQRERQAMTAVRTTTRAPVPTVLAVEQDPTILGAPFLVMERHYGRVPADDPVFTTTGWLLERSPEQQAQLYDNAIVTLAEIHHAEVSSLPSDFHGAPRDGDPTALEQHLRYWENFYSSAVGNRRSNVIEAALQRLRSDTPTHAHRTTVSWGDARVGNMMFGDDLQVTAVLDWELVSLGPPELDLSWFLFANRMYTAGMGAPMPAGFPDDERTLARYEEVTGYRPTSMDFHELFAATRMSISMLRVGNIMVEKGLLPSDATMPISNPASQLLAGLVGLPLPRSGEESWISGNR